MKREELDYKKLKTGNLTCRPTVNRHESQNYPSLKEVHELEAIKRSC